MATMTSELRLPIANNPHHLADSSLLHLNQLLLTYKLMEQVAVDWKRHRTFSKS